MANKKLFKKAVVIGVGLIGGSIACILKKRGLADKVVGSGRSLANMQKALKMGIIDESLPLEEAVKGADFIILCSPVLSIIPTLKKIAPHIQDGALVTDAGSTKNSLAKEAQTIASSRFTFIGSHPIAGTEKSGAENSFETLFDNHLCIITPSVDAESKSVEKLKTVWQTAGMNVVEMESKLHDKVFGAVSHLPHMVVFALVNAICDMEEQDDLIKFAAGGFKDFTRIASSPPEMWADIAISNSDVLLEQIELVKNQLALIESSIKSGERDNLLAVFKKSNSFRKELK